MAGVEGAILLTKVEKDIGVMEACVDELRQHLAFYVGPPRTARPVGTEVAR